MIEKTIAIVNPSGLHARPAASVALFAQDYSGTVEVIKEDKSGDLKSILTILSMGLKKGTEITLRVNGDHEAEYMESLTQFILNLKG